MELFVQESKLVRPIHLRSRENLETVCGNAIILLVKVRTGIDLCVLSCL